MSIDEAEKLIFEMCFYGMMDSYQIAAKLKLDHTAIKKFLESLFRRASVRELEEAYRKSTTK